VKVSASRIIDTATNVHMYDEVVVGWDIDPMTPEWEGDFRITPNAFNMFGRYVDSGARRKDIAIRHFGIGDINSESLDEFYYLAAPGGVYALVDGDSIVYVGYSTGLMARIGSHISAKEKKFTSVWYMSGLGAWDAWGDQQFACDHKGEHLCDCSSVVDDRKAWRNLEAALIDKFNPIYNRHPGLILAGCFDAIV
jgi:hypothetical protein